MPAHFRNGFLMEHFPVNARQGFTLIELSIVLVIIGLIVGGVLVGQNLIAAAGVRAQVTQIERYQTAVNTFKGKYGELPGDLTAATATQFGFISRGSGQGQGDGNGILEGSSYGASSGRWEGGGETSAFWVDLSTARLIDGSFTTGTANSQINSGSPVSGAQIDLYLPQAKLGGGNYVYVFSNNAVNYFGISATTVLSSNVMTSSLGLTVQQAFSIDKKIDDGLPEEGNVLAGYLSSSGLSWAGDGGYFAVVNYTAPEPATVTSCFDNGNVAGQLKYSMSRNGGAGVNCGLSFRFQ